ncbi:MAG: nitroreductase [Desulfobacula sp.]|jgi:nitroreductase/NAD-dependent dihydropyrimidine dehydrogenase PreA subunit|nr:nitroreductase [Desulfobacula sp.]MBT6340250.1 nitroreductase [Desulfobacula sp.]
MKIRRIEEKCTKCMLCVKDCASVVWKNINGIPKIVAPGDCNRCSHCLSVCPQGAVEHGGLDWTQIQKIDPDLIDPKIYETIARGRRSVRHYKDKDIPDQLIEKVIGLVNHSPTASNSQNVGYIVVSDKNILKTISNSVFGFAVKIFYFTKKFPGNLIYRILKIFPVSDTIARYVDPMQYFIDETKKGRDFILHNAPVLILVHGPKGKKFSSENCNISAGNIMNYAYCLGLGTCYIGFLNLSLKYSKKLRKHVNLPENRMVYACLIMGYPAYKHANTASRKKPAIKWIQ